MNHFIQFDHTGGPDVLHYRSGVLAGPAPGEVQVQHRAVGVNFLDTYHRSGLYPVPLPSGLGVEAAGAVVAVGAGVTELKVGDRVAYLHGPLGAYAEARNIAATHLVPLPAQVSFDQAAAMMVRGLTANMLLRRVYRVQAGQTILVHAAAGGMGLLLCQWARALDVRVIGTVSTVEKGEMARANGCTYPIPYENFVAQVKELTEGRGVPVVYDGVGRDTFMSSLDCLAPLGMMVTFGNASGPVPPLNVLELSRRGSLTVARPRVNDYTQGRSDLLQMSREMFDLVQQGALRVHIGQSFPLAQAAEAHRAIESRQTTGSTLLHI